MSGIKNKIILVGFMGSGKTTVARELSQINGWTIKDTDAIIEANENMSISDIFHSHGEEYFRKLESQMIESLSSTTETIIATGGGLPIHHSNMTKINMMGCSFYLMVGRQELAKRLKNDVNRPLIQVAANTDLSDLIDRQLRPRESIYKSAHYIVQGNRPVSRIAKRIWNLYLQSS